MLSSFAIQIGLALSKSLFDSLGAVGTVFLCKAFGAVFLLLLYRPTLQRQTPRTWVLLGLFGSAMAIGNLAFYAAIDRIPLGIASTLEFIGPLSVAVLGSRRWLDLLWVVLAAIGVLLLAPWGGGSLDWLGVALALTAALCWASYILLSVPVGQAFVGGSGLAIGLGIASLLLLPAGVAVGGSALLKPIVLGVGLAVAVLNTVLPYSLEFAAMKRVPPRIFGILVSIEPAIAALVGFLFLGEQLNLQTLLAIVCVTAAAIGATWFGRQKPHA